MSFGPKFLPATHPGWIIQRWLSKRIRSAPASLTPKLWRPMKASIFPAVDVSVKQWAAVRTHWGANTDPPQMWSQPKKQCWTLTMKGNSPGIALTPPVMNGDTSCGAANAAAKASDKNKKIFIFHKHKNWNSKDLRSFTVFYRWLDHNLISSDKRKFEIYFGELHWFR